jgi:hypothetical protein
VERATLLIADIGGYTKFMQVHRMNLAHAHDTISRLLEAVIGGAGKFKLAKLEGDAAFFWLPYTGERPKANDAIVDMRKAFLKRRGKLIGDRMCSCEGCMQMENLRIKFIIHDGNVVRQRVAGNEELAGIDVIVLHRLLKNEVPLKEYVLGTDTVMPTLESLGAPQFVEHDLEGIGKTRTHYVDLSSVQVPDDPPPSGAMKLLAKIAFEARALPYILGLKEPCKGFENMPNHLGDEPSGEQR